MASLLHGNSLCTKKRIEQRNKRRSGGVAVQYAAGKQVSKAMMEKIIK